MELERYGVSSCMLKASYSLTLFRLCLTNLLSSGSANIALSTVITCRLPGSAVLWVPDAKLGAIIYGCGSMNFKIDRCKSRCRERFPGQHTWQIPDGGPETLGNSSVQMGF